MVEPVHRLQIFMISMIRVRTVGLGVSSLFHRTITFFFHVLPDALCSRMIANFAVGMYNVVDLKSGPAPFESAISGQDNDVSALLAVNDVGYSHTGEIFGLLCFSPQPAGQVGR